MNRLITFVAMCMMAMAAVAQGKAEIEVSYAAHKTNLRDGKTDLVNQYVLLANTTESKFYSPITEYIDSLNSTSEGKAKIKEISRAAFSSGNLDDIPRQDGTYYVVKSLISNRLKHYENVGLEKFIYEEQIAQWSWEIGDSAKTVLGYECLVATADYHGRKWTVWFTPEIPVKNGPWKLDGLPGLILEAEAEGGQYRFIATGIQQTTKLIVPVYLADEYEHVTRLEYLRYHRAFLENPLGKINAQFGSTGTTISASGGDELNDLFVSSSVVDFLETDYH